MAHLFRCQGSPTPEEAQATSRIGRNRDWICVVTTAIDMLLVYRQRLRDSQLHEFSNRRAALCLFDSAQMFRQKLQAVLLLPLSWRL
ncbi:MAG: hypothetical protein WCA45_16045 [Thiobacillaceae bacterium]